jgi:hypothetical protein
MCLLKVFRAKMNICAVNERFGEVLAIEEEVPLSDSGLEVVWRWRGSRERGLRWRRWRRGIDG